MTLSRWKRLDAEFTPASSTDILIVGGGIAGLSTAFWLKELKPQLKITVIDKGKCFDGASGRNAGFLTVGSAYFYQALVKKWGQEKAFEILKFSRNSLNLLEEKILKQDPQLSFDLSTSMTLFQTERKWENWTDDAWDYSSFGFKEKESSALPEYLKNNFFYGLEGETEYAINPLDLLTSLRKKLKERNVQIIEDLSAFEIVPTGIRTELLTMEASKIILALNSYSSEFHSTFATAIRPVRAQMLAVELDQKIDWPHLYYEPSERVYWRRAGEKVLVIGGKRYLDESGETGTFDKISPPVQNGLEEYLSDRLGLSYKVLNRWSGTMGFTENELPYVQRIEASSESYVIGGFSGHGMGLAFNSAKDLAEILTGAKKESFFAQFSKVDFKL